jgi:hypothetical protein
MKGNAIWGKAIGIMGIGQKDSGNLKIREQDLKLFCRWIMLPCSMLSASSFLA